jgi:hypothetical protein
MHYTMVEATLDMCYRQRRTVVHEPSSPERQLKATKFHEMTRIENTWFRKSSGTSRSRVSKQPKKNKIIIPIPALISLMTLPQPTAAKKLGVSISTLKRRFYELSWGRWPVSSVGEEEPEIFDCTVKTKSIDAIINKTNSEDTVSLDPLTVTVLQCAFKQQFLPESKYFL